MLYDSGNNPTGTGSTAVEGGVITQVPPFELAATNLLLQSAAFNTTWTTSGAIAITPNTTASPRGVVEADTLNDNGGTTGEVQQAVAVANDAVARTFSVYLLAGTSTQARVGLRYAGGTALDGSIDVNPANGTILASNGNLTSAAVEALSIGGAAWIRASVCVTNNGSGNVTATPYVQPASASAAAQGTIIAWGAQLEVGSHASLTAPAPSTQIPTTTAQVTRTAGLIPSWLIDASNASYQIQVFTANGTWTKPAGHVASLAIVVGGGSGSAGTAIATQPAGGGGGGGTAIELLQTATMGATETVTVGAGGTAGTAAPTGGGAGGTSSLGALLSATGGGATTASSRVPGIGGVGSGGSFNFNGSDGDPGYFAGGDLGGQGGASFLGGAVRGGLFGAYVKQPGKAFGGGASGVPTDPTGANTGETGAAGIVIVIDFMAT